MAYCGPLGIPYLEFQGWDDVSRSAALAWRARENTRCGGCNHTADEIYQTTWDGNPVLDPAGNPIPAAPPKWLVETDICPTCAALQRAQTSPGDTKGIHYRFRRNPAASPIDTPREGPSAP